MKRVVMLAMVALLVITVLALAAGCQSGDTPSSSESTAGAPATGEPQTSESSPPSTSPAVKPADSPVLSPHDLLSAEEASEISGHPTTLDPGTLSEDPASGTISERYAYDLDGTGIHALVEIHQDGFKPGDAVAAGETALSEFSFVKELLTDEITFSDIGAEAFTLDGTGQLHMYYEGYYIVVAFDADPYDSSMNAPLNVWLGTRILTNLKEALR